MKEPAAPSAARLRELFLDPAPDFTPCPIWWWSGERLDSQRLRWQLERLVEAGLRNVMVLSLAPSGPLYGADPDDPPLFSEPWWELFQGVCADARELGVRLWFYDQIGFSGANFQGQLVVADRELVGQWLGRVARRGTGELSVAVPAGCAPLQAVATPVEDTANSSTTPVDVADGVARFACEQEHVLSLVYVTEREYDYLSPEACRRLVDTVHGEFERRAGAFFGDVIVGSFQDEMGALPTWSRVFAEEFATRCGYDLTVHLDRLWTGDGDQDRQVRVDYQRVRAELAEEAFFRPLFEWHESRSLLCGFDNHARTGHGQIAVRTYGDYQRTHRWFSAPGTDHAGEAKLNSSLAHLYGRPRSWIEAFHSTGWGGTLEETYDWLLPWLRAGSNLYNPHAVYYATRGGWWEWAAPSTCWRQPYWPHYSHFAGAVTRLCAVLSQGDHVCDIGVLYPATTVQAGWTLDDRLQPAAARADETYRALIGQLFWGAPEPGVLDRDGRDFDVLDEASIQNGAVDEGTLAVRGERYRCLILPSCTDLEPATVAALSAFAAAGGLMVLVGAVCAALEALLHADNVRVAATPEEVTAALQDLPRSVEAPVPTLRRRTADADVLFVPAVYPRATQGGFCDWNDEGWSVRYTFDAERYADTMSVWVADVDASPQLWDPLTGAMRSVPHRARDGGVEVLLDFADGPAALLVFAQHGAATPPRREQVMRADEICGPWEGRVLPVLDNRFGDVAWPAHEGSPPIETWTLEHRHDADALWSPAHATYGQFGWRTGPMSTASLPDAAPHGAPVPVGPSWAPVVYSQSRGILHDPGQRFSLGPKGHVPEEFIDFGQLEPGEGVQFRTSVVCDEPVVAHLALGAATDKQIWVNGQAVLGAGSGYLSMVPIRLQAGRNAIEWRLTAPAAQTFRGLHGGALERTVRAYWAVVANPASFLRPEWIEPNGTERPGERVRFEADVHFPAARAQGQLQVGATGPSRVFVNGGEIGRQENNYGGSLHRYDVRELRAGRNTFEVEVADLGLPVACLVDGSFVDGSGGVHEVLSGLGWKVTSGSSSSPVGLRRDQWLEPGWNHRRRRPHPLPNSDWLEEVAADDTVLRLTPDAFAAPGVEWLRWPVPPGARMMHLRPAGPSRLWVDGEEHAIRDGIVDLHRQYPGGALVELRVDRVDGRSGGALLDGPVTYDGGAGPIALGAWQEAGLGDWSGGVVYRAGFDLAQPPTTKLFLDLGRVRGTASVTVNAESAGTRIWSPYRFDVSAAARAGRNSLEVTVLNTLAPRLAAVSPTTSLFPGQCESGLFGPVHLLAVNELSDG